MAFQVKLWAPSCAYRNKKIMTLSPGDCVSLFLMEKKAHTHTIAGFLFLFFFNSFLSSFHIPYLSYCWVVAATCCVHPSQMCFVSVKSCASCGQLQKWCKHCCASSVSVSGALLCCPMCSSAYLNHLSISCSKLFVLLCIPWAYLLNCQLTALFLNLSFMRLSLLLSHCAVVQETSHKIIDSCHSNLAVHRVIVSCTVAQPVDICN